MFILRHYRSANSKEVDALATGACNNWRNMSSAANVRDAVHGMFSLKFQRDIAERRYSSYVAIPDRYRTVLPFRCLD